jgi:hypothetical protein
MNPQNSILLRQRCRRSVSQNSGSKRPDKPKKDLVPTQNKRALDGKEVIRIMEYDKIRELVVRSKEPNMQPAVLNINEFNRLKQQAKVNVKENVKVNDSI